MAASTPRPEDVLEFWFADALSDAAKAAQRMSFWFSSDRETDRDIAQRFSSTLESASGGVLQSWSAEPHSALALVIVLDQFPRNVYRATAAAFAHDLHALEITRQGVAAGHLDFLHPIEQGFFIMPYQHCEDLACQREGLPLFERVVENAAPEWRGLVQGFLDYAVLHLRIIQRFGRFPHRNAILGRESTPEELEYLRSNTGAFGQAISTPT